MGDTMVLALSSGLEVELRKFKTRDKDLMADKKFVHGGNATSKLLEAVTVKTISPGRYRAAEGSVAWGDVLNGEREIAFTKLRLHTWPTSLYPHEHSATCERCGKTHVVDLPIDDMEIKPLGPEGLRHLETGEPIQTDPMPSSGKRVSFRLLRGRDEKELERLRGNGREKVVSAVLKLKVVSVEGVEQKDLHAFLEDLDGADEGFLEYELGRFDTGVDPEVKTECPACRHVTVTNVPVGAAFLFPSYRPRPKPGSTS